MRFCRRYGVALQRKTHAAQTGPKQLAPGITKFHSKLLRVCRRGVYQTKDIANMDQTPLPFELDDGKTYADKGSSEVWCVSGSSGLDKRQCTVQLTIFVGVPRVRPLVIFHGKGLRITRKEQEAWNCRVQLAFEPKAWCDESMMIKWIWEQWGNICINPPTTGSTEKILVADGVKALLKKKNTKLVNVAPGCTSRVQPLDVSFNKPLRMLLDNSLRSILRRTCNGILKQKSVPLKEEH